ncbi:MAG: hypothetical protein NTW86_14905 [Candidatus Sumerlaeota bacterium]|nr:hypothetical protein [Candidatus Sumerlaeota bacterium]
MNFILQYLAMRRESVGLLPQNEPLKFDIKWEDNVPDSNDILDFIDHGDVAPNSRFNCRYQASLSAK